MIIDFKIIVIDFIKLIKFIRAISFHVFKGSEASELPENQSNKKLLYCRISLKIYFTNQILNKYIT